MLYICVETLVMMAVGNEMRYATTLVSTFPHWTMAVNGCDCHLPRSRCLRNGDRSVSCPVSKAQSDVMWVSERQVSGGAHHTDVGQSNRWRPCPAARWFRSNTWKPQRSREQLGRNSSSFFQAQCSDCRLISHLRVSDVVMRHLTCICSVFSAKGFLKRPVQCWDKGCQWQGTLDRVSADAIAYLQSVLSAQSHYYIQPN